MSDKKKPPLPNKVQSNLEILKYLLTLIIQNKKWWLLPPLIVLAFLSLFVSLSGKNSILPAIYALF